MTAETVTNVVDEPFPGMTPTSVVVRAEKYVTTALAENESVTAEVTGGGRIWDGVEVAGTEIVLGVTKISFTDVDSVILGVGR